MHSSYLLTEFTFCHCVACHLTLNTVPHETAGPSKAHFRGLILRGTWGPFQLPHRNNTPSTADFDVLLGIPALLADGFKMAPFALRWKTPGPLFFLHFHRGWGGIYRWLVPHCPPPEAENERAQITLGTGPFDCGSRGLVFTEQDYPPQVPTPGPAERVLPQLSSQTSPRSCFPPVF